MDADLGDKHRLLRTHFFEALDLAFARQPVRRALVAVSGGPDSTALAWLAAEYQEERPTGPRFLVGHVNHCLRGDESDGDELFVESLAKRLELPFLRKRGSVPQLLSEPGKSLEMAAREVRLAAYRQWAEEERVDAILVGHHRRDQQETVFLRMARGTGPRGLRGIASESLLADVSRNVRLLRPLLQVDPQELESYLESCAQEFRRDGSNQLGICPRNRLRHRVLPLIEKEVHPGIRPSLERLSRWASEWCHEVESWVDDVFDKAALDESGVCVGLKVEPLRECRPMLLREVLARLCRQIDPERYPFSEAAFGEFRKLLESPQACGSLELSGGGRLEVRYGVVRYDAQPPVSIGGGVAVTELSPAGTCWGQWRLSMDSQAWRGGTEDPYEEWIDADRLTERLKVRARRAGDVFQPLGMSGRKKLKEFFRDRRVPPNERCDVPLIVCGDDVVWVVGLRLADWVRVRPETTNAVRLRASLV